MVNIYYSKITNKYEGELYAKELRVIKRGYPIFFYDQYREGGSDHCILKESIKKKCHGYLNKPLFKVLNVKNNQYAILNNKDTLKIKKKLTQGDIFWFTDPVNKVKFMDYNYQNYTRRLMNVSYWDRETDKMRHTPAWVYYLSDLKDSAIRIPLGDIFNPATETPYQFKKIKTKEVDKINFHIVERDQLKLSTDEDFLLDVLYELVAEEGDFINYNTALKKLNFPAINNLLLSLTNKGVIDIKKIFGNDYIQINPNIIDE